MPFLPTLGGALNDYFVIGSGSATITTSASYDLQYVNMLQSNFNVVQNNNNCYIPLQGGAYQGSLTPVTFNYSSYALTVDIDVAHTNWNSLSNWANQTLDAEIDIGNNEKVAVPLRLTLNPNDEHWNVWVAEIAEETDRRQRAREIANQQAQQRERERALAEAERIAAEARARVILFEHLSKEQQESWDAHKLFFAEINGKRWKFIYGTHGNVSLMDGETPIERFCIAPIAPHDGGRLPVEDVVLAQMLLISADEKEFRRIANVTPLRRPNLLQAA